MRRRRRDALADSAVRSPPPHRRIAASPRANPKSKRSLAASSGNSSLLTNCSRRIPLLHPTPASRNSAAPSRTVSFNRSTTLRIGQRPESDSRPVRSHSALRGSTQTPTPAHHDSCPVQALHSALSPAHTSSAAAAIPAACQFENLFCVRDIARIASNEFGR